MKLVKKGQGEHHDAKGHFDQWGIRMLDSAKDTQRLTITISHFLPQGGAEMSSSATERVYFIISGSLLVKGKAEEHLLEPGDLLYIAPGEEREIQTYGTEPASILVIVNKLD